MRMTTACSLSLFTSLLLTAACGGGGSQPGGTSQPAPASTPAPPAAAAPAAGSGNGVISGRVLFEGQAPAQERIQMDADAVCQKAHTSPVYSEVVTVNDNGTLRDVFVYVKAGVQGSHPTPSETVTFDQKGCHYTPHVFGVMAGQQIKILNSDDTLHNVHALPANSSQFNIAMPKFLKEKVVSFENPEVMVRVKCEVHPWMGAWIGVLNHPFHGVSDSTGAFSLKGLPAGTYTIEAWHEKYGQQTQEVTLAADETKDIAFTFKAN